MGGFFGINRIVINSGSGGGGIGGAVNFAPPAGVIDPAIVGFVAGLGIAGTGRVKITLSANTSFEGLPAGVDGQQLFLIVIAGNFLLTLLHLNGSTAQKQILAAADTAIGLDDTLGLFYDGGLAQWVLVP